ncbi:hypothetical protein T4B_3202, partial [Trichinella pseudospiralis]
MSSKPTADKSVQCLSQLLVNVIDIHKFVHKRFPKSHNFVSSNKPYDASVSANNQEQLHGGQRTKLAKCTESTTEWLVQVQSRTA